MAKKSTNKAKENSIAANVEVGGSIGGNLIIGHGNIVNLAHEQISFRSLHQLPQPPADFTGRETLIDQLLNDFNSHKGATISGLTGMGGIGKTALGLVVAHKIANNYPDAQIFLDLKGTTEPLSAMDIARHVILSFEPIADLRALDDTKIFSAYQSVLHGKKILLFFDNARSSEQIAHLRPPDTCAMLVTSRWTFSVPGLGSRRVDVMNENDATNFLIELCPSIKNNAADLANACAYLPLALRIAGSFLQVNNDWSIEKYLTQLNDRKKRLVTLKESHVEAELNSEPDLLATFELSYNQLSEENRKLWRMLGVFTASFDASAAQAMWDLNEDETKKLLSMLRRYSLLEFDENLSRYSLHDLLIDYALSQMEEDDEGKSRLSHAKHYMNILQLANHLYIQGNENILHGLQLLDSEWQHIMFAQSWVKENVDMKDVLELCSEYPNAGYMILPLRLHPRVHIDWLSKGLDSARKLGNKEHQGFHLGNLGKAYAQLGEMRKAIELSVQQLVITREMGDHKGEGNALGNLGIAYKNLGEVRKAIEFYEQQLIIVREIGDRQGEGNALGNLGNAYADLGDSRKAIDFCKQQLIIAREIGDRGGEGNALGNLGTIYIDLGEVRKAIEFYEQQLAIMRELRQRRGEGVALGNLGVAYKNLGDRQKAVEFYKQQLAIVREIGNRQGEGNALYNTALVLDDLGEKDRAIDLVKQALKIYEAIESPTAETARTALIKWGALE